MRPAAAARSSIAGGLRRWLARRARAVRLECLGSWLLGLFVVACGRFDSAPDLADASGGRNTENVPRAAPAEAPSFSAASWDSVPLEKLRGGAELGCEARRQGAWLRVRCRETPNYGVPYELQLESGRDPRQLVRRVGAGGLEQRSRGGQSSAAELPPSEARGLVELLTPFEPGTRIEAGISWLGAYRSLELKWPARAPLPEWVGGLSERVPPKALDTCRGLQRDLEARLGRLQLDPADRRGLPPGLNHCVAGNAGAWVVSAEDVSVLACGEARCLAVQFAISLVDAAGERSPSVGPRLRFEPGTLSLEQGALDFDGDRQEDFFTLFETHGQSGDPSFSRIWTRRDRVEPLPEQPEWFFHRVARTDTGLPSLLTYGPFVTALPAACGQEPCPLRLTGPELLAHNTGQSFSFVDGVARHQLEQSCGELGPLELPGSTGAVPARLAEATFLAPLARAVACRRLFGAATGPLLAELQALRPRLCAEPSRACPVFDVLGDWARLPLPAALVGATPTPAPSVASASSPPPAALASSARKHNASRRRSARRHHEHRARDPSRSEE